MISVGRVALLSTALAGGPVNLVVADATHAHTAEAPALTQTHIIVPAAASHALASDNVGLSAGSTHTLTVADGVHAHSAEAPAASVVWTLVAANTAHAHSAEAPTPFITWTLVAADAFHAPTSENVTVSIGAAAPGGIIGWNQIGLLTDTGVNSDYPHEAYVAASGQTYTAAAGDIVTEFAVYGSTASAAHVDVAIYTVVGGIPVTRVGAAATVTIPSTPGWGTVSAGIPLTEGVQYTIGMRYFTDANWTLYWSNTGTLEQSIGAGSATPLPATWVETGIDNIGRASYYATVTGGGVSINLTVQSAAHAVTSVAPTLTVGTVVLTPNAATHGHTATTVPLFRYPYPVTVSGRKLLDQHGNVFLIKGMASWGMGQHCSNVEITNALEELAALGFNTIIACPFGLNNPDTPAHHPYENDAGQDFFTGTPFQSDLGAAWVSVDWMMEEAARLGITVFFSWFVSWGTTGIRPDMVAATDAQLYTFGAAVATRYASYRNIVWHLEADDPWVWAVNSIASRIDALYHGIKDVEGVSQRLVTAEPYGTETAYTQFISEEGNGTTGYGWFHVDVNVIYRNAPGDVDMESHENSAETVELAWANSDGSPSMPFWCDEPNYIHNTGITYSDQQSRERNFAIFLEGGCGINFGDEWWWPCGGPGIFAGAPSYWLTDTLAAATTLQVSYCWSIVDQFCANPTWAPAPTFVVSGAGTGDEKVAAGASDTAALAYFPTGRSFVAVDTRILGATTVTLYWRDPTSTTTSPIATAEAPTSSRGVIMPAARGDGSRDWVLVMEGQFAGFNDLRMGSQPVIGLRLGSTPIEDVHLG